MRHPSLKELQDYFENETSEKASQKVRRHLEECNKCSKVMSEMAKVDILFAKSEGVEAPAHLQQEVMAKASELLASRRAIKELKSVKQEKRKQQLSKTIKALQELKEGALSELKIPVLQTAAISLFLIVLTKVATTETYIEYNQVISDDVQVVHSELLGDENEIY